MAHVLLVSSYPLPPFDPGKHGTYFLMKHSAEIDRFGVHQLTDDPEKADLILFVEAGRAGFFAERVRTHAYFRRYRNKCFLYDQGDLCYPLLPGVYASLSESQYRPDHTRTGFYMVLSGNVLIRHIPATGDEKYLASFVGSMNTSPVRKQIFSTERPDFYLHDTSSFSARIRYHGEPGERLEFWEHYANSIADSKFSLCPRGVGPNSVRLYESMKMGRACVILSDDWHPNDGVDWDSFSIRVPESEAARLPEILEELEPRAVEMGNDARKEWETWFSEAVAFHHVVELCLEIDRARKGYRRIRSLQHYKHIPMHFRRFLSSKANMYRNEKKIYWW